MSYPDFPNTTDSRTNTGNSIQDQHSSVFPIEPKGYFFLFHCKEKVNMS